MTIDLYDPRLKATIRATGDRVKLTLEYPREDVYRNIVLRALADLLVGPRGRPGGPEWPLPIDAD